MGGGPEPGRPRRPEWQDDPVPRPAWWTYGLAGNDAGLATFLRYSREQGLARRLIDPAELFAPETLESYVI